jgi:cyclohexa-1,5-dienecarbonyl-CoA hydratase
VRARLDFTHQGRVARLTLAAPKANIIDVAMIGELDAACGVLAAHRGLVAIAVMADGPNFSFGASVEDHRPAQIERALAAFHGLLRRVAALPAPTIAAVRGLCLGGGWELVLACDLVVAEDDAQFGLPEITLGVFPPAASVLLPARAGAARASALVLTGASITGREAGAMGLAAQVVPTGNLETALDAWLESAFVPRSPAALRFAAVAARADIRRALHEPLQDVERLYLDQLMKEPDAAEGIQAFLEKRPPRWHSAESP